MDAKEVKHIAKLARLKFEGPDLETITNDMSGILKWIDVLQKADITAVKNIPENNTPLRMRDDKVRTSNISQDIIKNAPERHDHFFSVPKMVE